MIFHDRNFKICPSGYARLLFKMLRSGDDGGAVEAVASLGYGAGDGEGPQHESKDDDGAVEAASSTVTDDGRPHVPYPHTGPLFVVNRSVRYPSSTAMSHANDMHKLLDDFKRAFVIAIVDGGSDWSVKSLLTFFSWDDFGRTKDWMDLF